MYTQGLNVVDAHATSPADAEREARFQARIEAEEKIEPKDWMPAAYGARSFGRSPSMPIPRSSACCRRATG